MDELMGGTSSGSLSSINELLVRLISNEKIELPGYGPPDQECVFVDCHQKLDPKSTKSILIDMESIVVVSNMGDEPILDKEALIRALNIELTTDDEFKYKRKYIEIISGKFQFNKFKEFCRLVKNRKNKIHWIEVENGSCVCKLIYDPDLYLNRTMIHPHKVVLNREVYTNFKSLEFDEHVYLFESKAQRHRFEEALKEETEEKVFENAKGPVHRLQKETRIWQKSNGSTTRLREFINDSESEYIELSDNDYLPNILGKSTVIVDEPGMGKTTLLHRLAANAAMSNWVMLVTLSKCHTFLQALPEDESQITIEEVCRFLCEAGGVKSKRNSEIIEQLLKLKPEKPTEHWPLVFFFDGFDEIVSKNYKKKFSYLLRKLKNRATICISSRNYDNRILLDCLSVFETRFRPLEDTQQKYFLKRYWKNKLQLKSHNGDKLIDSKMDLFISMLFGRLDSIFRRRGCNEFIGVPLQLKLISEGFLTILEDFLSSESSEMFENLRLSSLYDYFINAKLRIFLRDKLKLQTETWGSQSVVKHLAKDYSKIHERLAFRSLFDGDSSVKFKLISNIEDEDEPSEICLLLRSFTADNTEFLHKTLTEFFAAKYICYLMKKRHSNCVHQTLLQHLLQEVLLKPDFKVVRIFLDDLLETVSLTDSSDSKSSCNSILNNSAIYEHNISVMPRNAHNETALHICALEEHFNLTKFLLNYVKSNIKSNGTLLLIRDCENRNALAAAVVKGKNSKMCDLITAELSNFEEDFRSRVLVATFFTTCSEIISLRSKLYKYLINCSKTRNLNKTCDQILRIFEAEIGNFMSSAIDGSAEEMEKTLRRAGDKIFQEGILSINFEVMPNVTKRTTPMHYAAFNGHADVVNLLIREAPWLINQQDVNSEKLENWAPLHYAAERGNLEIVKALIAAGAEVDIIDRSGGTPLQRAAMKDKLEIVEYLLENSSANLHKVDKTGINIFTMAVRHHAMAVVVYLLVNYPVDIKHVDLRGLSVYEHAQKSRNFDMLNVLTTYHPSLCRLGLSLHAN